MKAAPASAAREKVVFASWILAILPFECRHSPCRVVTSEAVAEETEIRVIHGHRATNQEAFVAGFVIRIHIASASSIGKDAGSLNSAGTSEDPCLRRRLLIHSAGPSRVRKKNDARSLDR